MRATRQGAPEFVALWKPAQFQNNPRLRLEGAKITFMGTEAGSIAGELDRSWRGGGWSGLGLREILAGVDETSAAWKPPAEGVHSIWELLLHASCWERSVLARARGEENTPSDAENFSAPVGSWEGALSDADALHDSLVTAVRTLSLEKLGTRAAGCPYSVRFMLHGVAQHNLYHAGQMALMKKLLPTYARSNGDSSPR